MKRLTFKQKRRLLRRSIRQWRRNVVRKDIVYSPGRPISLAAPSVLSFRKNFAQTARFLAKFRKAIAARSNGRQRLLVDLVPVTELSVPVAIVLAAEFHRWSLVQNVRLRTNNARRWSPQVKELLSDLGTFDLLRAKAPAERSFGADRHITLTPLTSGSDCDGATIEQLQSNFSMNLTGFTRKPELYAGLTEAVENAIAHAYPKNFKAAYGSTSSRWWGASCIDVEANRLRFFVFDQGAGIPATLPTVDWWESIFAALNTLTGGLIANDSNMLRAAFQVGRTRTALSHRGLGLNRMADVVRAAPAAYLRVLSNRGEIIYHDDDRIEPYDHLDSIGGTLIEFNMPADIFGIDPRDEDGDATQHRA